MSNPTTYFGWQMPEPTDLVTDLPADFEVFGQAVDTDFQDLLGGTTGQLLSKTSDTNLDFTWVTPNAGDITGVTAGTGISGGGTSGTVTVTNSMATAIDAKGDLIAGTGADAFSRLAIGSNATVLIADSAEATGMKWASPPASAPASANNYVDDQEGTTSDSYTNLTTTQAVTLTTGTKVLVIVGCGFSNTQANRGGYMSYAISGATTLAASDNSCFGAEYIPASSVRTFGSRHSFQTVTAGSNTFTAKFRRQESSTANFLYRYITVIDLGS